MGDIWWDISYTGDISGQKSQTYVSAQKVGDISNYWNISWNNSFHVRVPLMKVIWFCNGKSLRGRTL